MRLIDADKLIEKLNKNSIFRTVTNAEDKNAIEIIEEQPTVNNWISVDDRLPEDNERVLIYVKWDCILIALRRNGEWNGHWENYEDDEVLAWMPLPNKYISEE